MKKSGDVKESSLPRGQTMVESWGNDFSSSMPLDDMASREGEKMGGGVTNLKHSLSDDSAVQSVKRK